MNKILCNDIYANTLKYNTYNVHSDSHSNISEHKTTRIKMIVTIKIFFKLLLIRNMRHISYNDFLAKIDDGS